MRRELEEPEYDPLKWAAEGAHNLMLRLSYARELCDEHAGDELFRSIAHAESLIRLDLEQTLDYREDYAGDFTEELAQELWRNALRQYNEHHALQTHLNVPTQSVVFELAARALGRLEGANNMSITRILTRFYGHPPPMVVEPGGNVRHEADEDTEDGEQIDIHDGVAEFAGLVARAMVRRGSEDRPPASLWNARDWLRIPMQPTREYNELVTVVNGIASGEIEPDGEDDDDDESDDDTH